MPEPASYPGSPSLAAEARDKVLQTFRHTLDMARAGRNEDALLGCDFILKMDPRFAPARRLLASLRGIAAGTVVDLAEFDAFGSAPARAPTPAPPPRAAPAAPEAPPPTPVSGWSAPAPAADPFGPAGSGLDGIGFGDLGANPFEAALPAPGSAPAPPELAPPGGFAPGTPAPDAFAAPSFAPAPPPAADPFAAPAPDPFAAPAAPADALAPSAFPADPFAAPAPTSFPAPAPAASVDPRIVQFLRQGDEAEARGHIQEAIDLWSRVFLIDLSNEEASRRIDGAREKQNEAARKLDVLLAEGVQHYDAGDLPSARNAFLQVLTLSETDATARNYLNQIDAALAGPAAGSAPPSIPDEPYLRDELESPVHPSFAEGLPSLDEHAGPGPDLDEAELAPSRDEVAASTRSGKVDGRLLVGVGAVVLLGVAAAAWFLFRPKPDTQPAVADTPPSVTVPAQNPLEKAQALFKQGKVEEALGILTAIPASDPRHDEALVFIDQFKSSAAPSPDSGPAVSEAQVDEARLSGLAALSSGRYIDAVKSLDLVVKARPEDTEASQALGKAREAVSALGAAIRSYNEQDYESAQRLLWDLRKQDPKNQDVEEYLFKSYFNDGILSLQSGNTKRAAESFKEATAVRPQDVEAQRHLKFARRYAGGTDDLLARIYVRHVSLRP